MPASTRTSSPPPPSSSTTRVFDPANPTSIHGVESLALLDARKLNRTSITDAAKHVHQRTAAGMSTKCIILLAIIFGIFAFILNMLASSNALLTLHPHNTQDCRVIKGDNGPFGAEDIVLDHHNILFISSDARTWLPHRPVDGITTANDTRNRIMALNADQQGEIFAYDARKGAKTSGQMVALKRHNMPADQLDFHPHGIDIPRPPSSAIRDKHSRVYLYIVNHARDGDQILVFEVVYEWHKDKKDEIIFPPSFNYLTRIESRTHFLGLNDLAAYYPVTQTENGGNLLHSVYVSNFITTGLGNTLWNMVEMMTKRAWGSVVLCQIESVRKNGQSILPEQGQCKFVLENLFTANGIAISGDQTAVYVAETMKMTIGTYLLPNSQEASSSSSSSYTHGSLLIEPLTLDSTLYVSTAVDNLSLDSYTDDLILGSHPKPMQATAHLDGPEKHKAPTQVVRIGMEGRRRSKEMKEYTEELVKSGTLSHEEATPSSFESIQELHLSLGEIFQGTSIAVWNRPMNELIMGGIACEGIFVCPYPKKGE